MTSAEFAGSRCPKNEPVALAELISALTFALDLTEGAQPGHGLRCCALGMRLAKEAGLPKDLWTPLYYALLLKDIGCSSNAARMTQVVAGDDRSVKATAKLADWTSLLGSSDPRTVRSLWKQVLPDDSVAARAARILSLALHRRQNNREMIELRCERGSEILRKLRLGHTAADAVLRLDEHWDGSGYPDGLRGESISLIARICAIAQHLDVFACAYDCSHAILTLLRRRAKWFDPRLVDLAIELHWRGQLWEGCTPGEPVNALREHVVHMEPAVSGGLEAEYIDMICEGFAEVVDAKSPFTYQHSLHVARVAEGVARVLDLPFERQRLLWRAALLHDLGKLSVPNTILDKPGRLTEEEWATVRRHPALSASILERVSALRELAVLAAEHHERLDGSGYPHGLRAEDLSLESRVLAIADQFAGMTEQRPYDHGYDAQGALELLRTKVPDCVDARCFDALCAWVEQTTSDKSLEVTTAFAPETSMQTVEVAR